MHHQRVRGPVNTNRAFPIARQVRVRGPTIACVDGGCKEKGGGVVVVGGGGDCGDCFVNNWLIGC